jgi:TonB family protein
MTDEATNECHGSSDLPTERTSEASAFIVGLLSGAGQQSADNEGPSSIPMGGSLVGAPEPAAAQPESTQSACAPNVAPSGSGEPITSHSANAAAPKRYSKINVPLMIVSLGMLTVGSGLAIGYGFFGRQAKPTNEPTVHVSGPSATDGAARAKPMQAQTPKLNSVNTSLGNPALDSAGLSASSFRHDDLHGLPRPVPSVGSDRADATADAPLVHTDSISQNDFHANEQVSERRAEISAQTRSESPLPLHESSAREASTFGTSARPFNDDRTSTGSIQPVKMPPAVTTLDMGADVGATTPLALNPIAADAHAPADRPPVGEARQPVVAPPLGRIEPCQLIHPVQPVYSREAKKLHVEGNVELRVVVGTDGNVQNVSLVSGLPLLAPAAIDAARQFRYKPAMLNGQPIETVQTVDMSFKLKN